MEIKTYINQNTTADLSPQKLDELVYDKAVERHCETFGEPFLDTPNDILMLQMLACSVLDIEVRNGGFDQFFYNNQSLYDHAQTGLEIIGATEHAKLLHTAAAMYREQKDQFINSRNVNLDELDEKYFQLENLSLFRQRFIALNIEKFYDSSSL